MRSLPKGLCAALGAFIAICGWVSSATAVPVLIDPTPPAFDDPPSPWQSLAGESTVTYAFKTSWDGIAWTDDQKTAAYDAINRIDSILPDQTFVESGDFTIRWAGSDLFKDWRDTGQYTAAGWDLTGALAIAYKHNNAPWDHTKYPNNEIYFNTTYAWSFLLPFVDPTKYDFWTVLLHETIHMLACDDHAIHENEVMFPTIDVGQRKFLQKSDAAILRAAGYNVLHIAEPGTLAIFLFGLAGLSSIRRRRRNR